MNRFYKAFTYVLGNEGHFSNDEHDSGGATCWGITHAEYQRWAGRAVSIDEMKKLPQSEAMAIYHKWYWLPLNLDLVNDESVAIAIFDQGVNRGIGTIAKAVQRIVGAEPDGHIGIKTITKINQSKSSELVLAISKQAEESYQEIVKRKPSQKVFLKGWLNRARRLLDLIKGP